LVYPTCPIYSVRRFSPINGSCPLRPSCTDKPNNSVKNACQYCQSDFNFFLNAHYRLSLGFIAEAKSRIPSIPECLGTLFDDFNPGSTPDQDKRYDFLHQTEKVLSYLFNLEKHPLGPLETVDLKPFKGFVNNLRGINKIFTSPENDPASPLPMAVVEQIQTANSQAKKIKKALTSCLGHAGLPQCLNCQELDHLLYPVWQNHPNDDLFAGINH